MKRILFGDPRERLLSTLEIILRHWGYRVIAASQETQLTDFLQEAPPDLVILGKDLLAKAGVPLLEALEKAVGQRGVPLLVLTDESQAGTRLPHEVVKIPIDIFQMFTLAQKHLEMTPRRNLRLKVQLPGMFYSGDTPCLAEVLSLSVHGLFIKTGCRVESLDRLRVIFPLLGMKTEVELEGRVIYRVLPGPENNYLQGVGIEFSDLPAETLRTLQDFIETRLLGDISETRSGARDLDVSHLLMHGRDMTLRVTSVSPESK